MTSAKTLPDDRSCRAERGGCGRTVLLVLEKYEKDQYFGRMRSNRKHHLTAIHEEDFDETKHLRVARPKPEAYRKHRCALEDRCNMHGGSSQTATGCATMEAGD
jgi:hypothetical protein